MDGDLLNACRVSRGEITYVDCYDETVARAMGRLTPEQLRQGNEAQERG